MLAWKFAFPNMQQNCWTFVSRCIQYINFKLKIPNDLYLLLLLNDGEKMEHHGQPLRQIVLKDDKITVQKRFSKTDQVQIQRFKEVSQTD